MKDLKLFKNMNVLYVDDDKEACERLKKILEYYFDTVQAVTSPAEAMEIYKKGRCNLLLVDYDMPIMNGYEFIKEVRILNDKIPAVIISSYDDKEKLFNAIKLELVDYLVKPYDLEELKELLYKVLEWMEKKGVQDTLLSKNIKYSFITKKLLRDNKEIALSPSEFKILEILLNNEDRLVHYETLMEYLGDACTHHSLVSQVYKLKKKLGVDIIKNVKDLGYILSR